MSDMTTLADLVGTAEPSNVSVDDLKDAAPEVLEAERRSIVESAKGNFRDLTEEQLMRLAYITSTLRRRASGPPKAPKSPKAPKGPKPTLGSLGDLL